MMVIEGKLLLAMGGVIGVIEVKHNGPGRLWVAGKKVVDQRACESVEILAVDTVFQTGKGWGTRQVLCGLQRGPLHAELQQGVVPETIGIIAIRIPRSDLVDTLGQELPEGVINIGLLPLIVDSGSKAFGEANLAVDTTQQESTKI
jgi:hypothetical protein